MIRAEKRARTFLHKLLNTLPPSLPRNARSLEIRGRERTFQPSPLSVEFPHPSSLRAQKVNLCALSSCQKARTLLGSMLLLTTLIWRESCKNTLLRGGPFKRGQARTFQTCALSGPMRDTPPYRAIPFWDSIAEGVSHPYFRKIPVSVKFLSAILGPEMAAPILWTPGKNASVLQEKPCP